MTTYRSFDVAVEGGTLHVGVWGTGGPLVLCAHGITGNHVSFEAVASQLDGQALVVAPDLRGRGRSREISGPWGMRAHAADLVRTLDHLGADKADLLVGHSMGGFVAAVAGAEHADRVDRVLMIDGGLPPMDAIPEGLSTEELIRAVIGPAMERLDMTFPSREAYHDLWRAHPALAGHWSPYVERYLDHDLVGEPPSLFPSPRKDAVIGDVESHLVDDLVPRSLEKMPGPVRFLRAPRGILNDAPLYAEERIAAWAPRIPGFTSTTVPDVNHYTIVISERGACAVAQEVDAMLVRAESK